MPPPAFLTPPARAGQVVGDRCEHIGSVRPDVASAVAIWWGLWIFKSRTKRSWARRKEQKRLEELSDKLDNVDANRRMDVDEHEDKDRPTL